MDRLNVPILAASESIDKALSAMRIRDTRVVVIDLSESEHRLLMNQDLVNAKGEGKRKLRDVAGMGQLVVNLSTESGDLEAVLDEHKATLGVLPVDSQIVSLVTRHESLAAQLRAAGKVCVCTNDPQHQAKSPPAQDGSPCEYGDGHYECY